jgi:pimeloyl-ACP methyl ester carboxylesterase
MPPLLAHGTATLVAAMDQLNAADAAWLALDAPVQAFLRERMLAASPQALIGMADALTGEPDRVEELRATGLPVLVLHGAADDAWTPEQQAEMARRLGSAYAVVPRAAHSPAVEAPGADGARAAGLLGSAVLARRMRSRRRTARPRTPRSWSRSPRAAPPRAGHSPQHGRLRSSATRARR